MSIQFGKINNNIFVNSTATYENGIVSISSPENAEKINFYAPSNANDSDLYEINGKQVILSNILNNNPEITWVKGAPISAVYDSQNNKLFINSINGENSLFSNLFRNANAQVIENKIVINSVKEAVDLFNFYSPKAYSANDIYEVNGQVYDVVDLQGNKLESGWNSDVPVSLVLNENKLWYSSNGSDTKLPSDLSPLCPNFKVERNGGKVKISADKIQLNSLTSMVSGGVWAWGKTRPTKPNGENTKLWSRAELITTMQLSELTEGDIVKINENGTLVDFYVACHNYEQSLNGAGRTLVVRKDCYDKRQWHTSNVNVYASSAIDSWLNSTYKNMLDADIRALIGSTKIRYTPGNGNTTMGTLDRSVFLLSAYELGKNESWFNKEGTTLPNATNYQIAKLNGSTGVQWTRSPYTSNTNYAIYLNAGGYVSGNICSSSYGSRPAFTLPASAMVEDNGDGTYTFVADLSIEIDWPESDPLYARQWVYNTKGQYQTMLLGGVASTEDAPAYSPVLANNTWEMIAQACADRDPILDSWLVGDEKDEVINGETLTFVIVGKDHDDLADGSGKAPLTFGMKNLMAETRQMNATNTNSGSFAGSAMYSWLSGTIYPNLPTELKDAIKAVNKKTSAGDASSSIRTDPMYLWLFSEIEVFGTTTYSYAGEGTQYPYFATAAERIKRLSNGAGAASHWWERSPDRNTSRHFCIVNPSGSANNSYLASVSYGVCFGFCI